MIISRAVSQLLPDVRTSSQTNCSVILVSHCEYCAEYSLECPEQSEQPRTKETRRGTRNPVTEEKRSHHHGLLDFRAELKQKLGADERVWVSQFASAAEASSLLAVLPMLTLPRPHLARAPWKENQRLQMMRPRSLKSKRKNHSLAERTLRTSKMARSWHSYTFAAGLFRRACVIAAAGGSEF